jgi:hypothetical protein
VHQKKARRELAWRNEANRRCLLDNLANARRDAHRARREADRACHEADRARDEAEKARQEAEAPSEHQGQADVEMDQVMGPAVGIEDVPLPGSMDVITFSDSPFSIHSPDVFNALMAELPFAFGGPRDFDILTDVTGEMPPTDTAHDDVPQASSLDAASTPVVLTTTDLPISDAPILDVSGLVLETNGQADTPDVSVASNDGTD